LKLVWPDEFSHDAQLVDRADDVGFEDWFDATFVRRSQDRAAEDLEEFWNWAKHLYNTSGAVDPDVARVAYEFDALAAVEAAVSRVLADLGACSERLPQVDVDMFEVIRITVNGGYTQPSVDVSPPFDVSVVTVEVVEYLRGQLDQDDGVSFPTCSRHEYFYLRPAVVDGVAVWHCNRGGHGVAVIGELEPSG
jgi:hypothetical protein